jgi:hypothetical protein
MQRRLIVWALDVAGVTLLGVAGWLVAPALGIGLAGAGCLGLAAAVELGSRPRRRGDV